MQSASPVMYDDNEATAFEPIPLGARQRVIPRRTFKAVPSMITELPLEEILDEQVIATQRVPRVPRLPPPPPQIIRTNVRLSARIPAPRLPTAPPPRVLPTILSRFALPIGGAIAVALLCLYLVLPGHRHGLTAANVMPLGSGFDTPTPTFQITTADDEPPEAPATAPAPTPARSKRAHHRKVVAVDSATPLGNLRPRKAW